MIAGIAIVSLALVILFVGVAVAGNRAHSRLRASEEARPRPLDPTDRGA